MQQPRVLNNQTVANLPATILKPSYDRSELTSGIVHVGVGGFHRSHEAFYTETYMNKTKDTRWGICGIGLREGDRKMQEILAEQDYLYTLMVKQPDGQSAVQVIGCVTDFILGCDSPLAVIDKMAHEDTQIVSLTITEGGYNFNPATGAFDFTNPDVQHDLANPDSPRLVFGYLAAALKRRMDSGETPFTVQSCDNIQHNGNITRRMLLAYINAFDDVLAAWVADNVAFPNAMVDRITPATTAADIADVEALIGVQDKWPVTCEPFTQWVIEDTFSSERPRWEFCGAQFVSDVTPYETMKIRLLNASHTVLGVLGSLAGFNTINESIDDPLFCATICAFMDREVTPVLAPVAGIDLDTYKETLINRFGNPNIKDSLTRICSESSSKVATFLVPTIQENVTNKGSYDIGALVAAAWCYYSDTHKTHAGKPLEVIDVQAEQLQQAAIMTKQDGLAFIKQTEIFGNLAEQAAFSERYESYASQLYAGTHVTELMRHIVDAGKPATASTANA